MLLSLCGLIGLGQTLSANQIQELLPNQVIERDLSGLQIHRFRVKAKANDFLQIKVVPKGIDVLVSLSGADGQVVTEMDGKNGFVWRETVSHIADKDGVFGVEIKAYGSAELSGSYTIRAELRPSLARDQRYLKAEQHLSAGRKLSEEGGKSDAAIKEYEQAAELFSELHETDLEGVALLNLGWTHYIESDYDPTIASLSHAAEAFRKTEDKLGESKAINILGGAYLYLGQYDKATAYFEQSLTLKRDIKDRRGEGVVLNRLGDIQRRLGKNDKAQEYLEQALTISREVKNRLDEASVLNSLAIVLNNVGEFGKAARYYEQVLPITREFKDRLNEATVLNNLGTVYAYLSQYEKARDYFEQALPITRELKDRSGEGTTLFNLGNAYLGFNDFEKARLCFEQTLAIKRELHERSDEAHALNGLGNVYTSRTQYDKALEYYNQALLIRRKLKDRAGEMASLNSLGVLYGKLKQNENARNYYEQALAVAKEVQDKQSEGDVCGNLLDLWAALKNPNLAILYGKQAINLYQELRGNIKSMEPESQKSFLQSVEPTYRRLVEVLISEGRIPEAEQILEMLKQEEVFDYLRRDASESDKLQQRADLSTQEAAALKHYNEISDSITALGAEFGTLQDLQSQGVSLTPAQEKRYGELSTQIEHASRSFQVFLRQLAEEFAKRSNTEKDLQENLALQSDLKEWGEGVVFLYTLAGKDRYRVILVTPETQVDGKTEIKEAELNEKIAQFRAVAQNPTIDPCPAGKELYDILIKPVEKELVGAKAKTLLWSLDGSLRLLPLAALWDGKQFFGQKYQNVTITLASRTRLSNRVEPNWRALGLGVSEAKKVKEPNGTREFSFRSLPAVRSELRSIIQSAQSPNGVLPGQSLLDAEFNESALESQLLQGYKLIHIASHFSLNPGDSTRSFLLLGDGNVLTVDNIKNNPRLSFRGIELLTLSACQTAVVEKDSSGKEIEGFGYVAQQKGAKAILATLWSVADESTQLLMSEFYRLHKGNPRLTKAAALQLAQQEMIEGKLQPKLTLTGTKSAAATQEGTSERTTTDGTMDASRAPSFPYDPKRPYAHPFYWAPFILIGNWK
jgi:CHAT domain-containing protein/Tfp pilus assembly protein PilF